MRRSETFGAIAKALAAAQAEFKPVPKTKEAKVQTKKGGEYTYKYADLADVLGMAVPILAKHGISFLQPNERIEGKLFVTTLLAHESGEWMQSDGIEVDEMEWQWNEFEKKRILERADPRTIGGDFTYYRRYDGCSFIGIAPDEDVDAKNNGALPDKRGKNKTEATENKPQPEKPVQPKEDAPTGIRSQFFSKAKELEWGLGDIKKFIVKAYPQANGSTANLTEEQLTESLKVMAENKPADYFKMTEAA